MAEGLEDRRLLANVSVDLGQVVRPVNDNVLGVNVAWWDTNLGTAQTKTMVQAAGLTGVRFPGGSTSDTEHFNVPPAYNGRGTLATFANFIASIGATGMATLDYGDGSPQEGAAMLAYLNAPVGSNVAIGTGQQWNPATSTWVQKDWKTSGYWAGLRAATPLGADDGLNFLRLGRTAPFGIHYFEVGNEIYGVTWEEDRHGSGGDTGVAHDPATYVTFAKQFAALAQQIDPTISIGVNSGGIDAWITNVLNQCVSQGWTPGYISDHNYMYGPGQENDTTLLKNTISNAASPLSWAARNAGYRNLLTQKLGAAGAANVELLATEINSVYSDPGKQSTSLVNGLFTADAIGSILQTSYNGMWWWDLRNNWDTTKNNSAALYGWRQGGDYGMLGVLSTTPPPSTGTYVAYPSYYAEQLASKIVHDGDVVVKATSNDTNLSTYAVRQKNGHLDLLVINKSSTSSIAGTFALTGFQPATGAQVWQYGKAEDTAQSQTGNGAASLSSFTSTLSLSGASFTVSFPSYSMTVLDLAPAALPAGWGDADIGAPAVPGSAGVTGGVAGTWVVQGGGSDIGGTSDQFHFASRDGTGNFAALARVAVLNNTDAQAKAGVMVRSGLAADAPFVAVVQNPAGTSVQLLWRATPGAAAQGTSVALGAGAKWVKLIRHGDAFTGYYSPDGNTWTQVGSANVAMPAVVKAGLAVTARNAGLATGATFTGVAVVDAPAVVASAYVLATGPQSISVQFGTDVVAGTVGASDLVLRDAFTGAPGPAATGASYDAATRTATFTFAAALPSAVYEATVAYDRMNDGVGNFLAADWAQKFAVVSTGATVAIPGTAAVRLGAMYVATNGRLDVGTAGVILEYAPGASPIDTVRGWVSGASDRGRWDGFGVFSSAAAAGGPDGTYGTGVGYADNATAQLPTFMGQPVGTNSVLLRYALYGDANMDTTVNADDVALVVLGRAAGRSGWWAGDFDYDATWSPDDYVLLLRGTTYPPGTVPAAAGMAFGTQPVATPPRTTTDGLAGAGPDDAISSLVRGASDSGSPGVLERAAASVFGH